jgi:D-glycero-alpha-D-manno-heptose-7-phosphate kinase
VIIVQTPLRISFLGGGTDFEDFYSQHGGAVLSTAINRYAFVMVKERIDDLIYLHYSKNEIVESVDDVQHDLIREAMRMTGVSKGVEIGTFVDVVEGTGLGSSSSLTVGLLQALYAYQGIIRDAAQLAEQACHIEIGLLKRPIGKQDQYIAAYGGMRLITFNVVNVVPQLVALNSNAVRRLNEHLLLLFTHRTRKASDILTAQQARIQENTPTLKEMRQLVNDGIATLSTNLDHFGELLHETWLLKRQLANGVTDSEIDLMYSTAREAGAVGGKLCGAGGGGFLLLYCANGKKDDVRAALGGLTEIPFQFEPDGSKVIFNYRR